MGLKHFSSEIWTFFEKGTRGLLNFRNFMVLGNFNGWKIRLEINVHTRNSSNVAGCHEDNLADILLGNI